MLRYRYSATLAGLLGGEALIMALAIGAFERELLTPSRWDAFIEGDHSALTDAEKTGFNTFAATGCQWCHYSPYVGGASYQKLGVVKPWLDQTDQGLYQVTKDESDNGLQGPLAPEHQKDGAILP